jgi:type IV pilus assembly protein PilM
MTVKKFHNFLFAPSKYLLLPAVGIDISDRNIKYAELVPMGNGYRLGKYGITPLPQGTIENGRIVNATKLQELLTTLSKENGFSLVRAVLPEAQTYFFQITIPDAETNEALRNTIELTLDQHVPIPAVEAIFDFKIEERTDTDVTVSVVVTSNTIVSDYTEIFGNAGLTLLSLEQEDQALTRSIIKEGDERTVLIVDFGEVKTGIAVVRGKRVYFTATVNMGGQMLTKTLVSHFNISVEEAEKMKRTYGLRRNSPDQDFFTLLINNISVLRDEINKHFIYWHTHPDEKGNPRPHIEEIILIGGDSNLVGLPDYLETSLHVKTTVANVWSNVILPEHGIPEIPLGESLAFATAIGLSLNDWNE